MLNKKLFITSVTSMLICITLYANAAMQIGSNHWNVAWGTEPDPFINGYKNVTGTNPWIPEFLTEVKTYTVHRYMDWGNTNKASGDDRVHWKDRTQKNDKFQLPVAYEWMIDFSNRTQADMWITVPHRTFEDPQYWTELAKLIHAKLDSKLKLYIEYSNEVWNGHFKQYHYAVQNGIDLGFSDNGEHLYKGSQWFYVYASVRLFEKFEQVWGKNNPRLVKVVAGKAASTYTTKQHLDAFKDPVVNPNKITFSAYAIAPYFGNGTTSIDELDAAVLKAIDNTAKNAEILNGIGIDFIAYEGGQHVKENADIISRDPRIYQLYMDYLNGIDDYLSLFVHYVHVGKYKTNNSWGSKEFIGADISSSHKYRALVDYIKNTSLSTKNNGASISSRRSYKLDSNNDAANARDESGTHSTYLYSDLPSKRDLLE